ncbi:MAG: DNA recombination/repair protein RecA, partial [Verrucomicrobiota bacterium]
MPPKSAEKISPAEAKSSDTTKATANRDRDLEAAISTITKAYGDGSILRLGAAHAAKKIDVIP